MTWLKLDSAILIKAGISKVLARDSEVIIVIGKYKLRV
jgi:hypothetical protein